MIDHYIAGQTYDHLDIKPGDHGDVPFDKETLDSAFTTSRILQQCLQNPPEF